MLLPPAFAFGPVLNSAGFRLIIEAVCMFTARKTLDEPLLSQAKLRISSLSATSLRWNVRLSLFSNRLAMKGKQHSAILSGLGPLSLVGKRLATRRPRCHTLCRWTGRTIMVPERAATPEVAARSDSSSSSSRSSSGSSSSEASSESGSLLRPLARVWWRGRRHPATAAPRYALVFTVLALLQEL